MAGSLYHGYYNDYTGGRVMGCTWKYTIKANISYLGEKQVAKDFFTFRKHARSNEEKLGKSVLRL